MEKRKIVGLDPGATTGISVFYDGEISATQVELFKTVQPHRLLFDLLTELNPHVVVYEQFRFRQGMTGVVYTGIEVIGVINLWSQVTHTELDSVSSAEGKAFWTDAKLKTLGIYKKGLPHGMDATRVLCTWLMKHDTEWRDNSILRLRSI